MLPEKSHIADAATGVGFGGLLVSHLAQLNQVLQTILLVFSIASAYCAIRYYRRNTK
jgi:hypothetical protein